MLTKIKQALMVFLYGLIPQGFKRLVLLSTLYSKAAEEKIFNHVDFAKLNKDMKFASNCEAIESALHLKEYVWKGIDLTELVQNASCNLLNEERVAIDDARDIVDQLLDKLPMWIKYDQMEMKRDLLLMFCRERAGINIA